MMIRRLAYGLLFFSLIVLLSSVTLVSVYSRGLERHSIEVYVVLSDDGAGLDLDTSILTFGKVPIGGSITRSVQLENPYDFPVEVSVDANGEIASKLFYETPFLLAAHERISVPITLKSELQDSPQILSGEVIFTLR